MLIIFVAIVPGSALAQDKGSVGDSLKTKDELPSFEAHPDKEAAPDQIIVKFKENVGTKALSNVRSDEGLQKKKDLDLIDAEVDKVSGQSVEQAISSLESRPDVEYAEPDYIVHPTGRATGYADEPRFGDLWGLNNTGQAVNSHPAGTADVDIDAEEASAITQGDPNLVVAVIDDGVDFSHPDLKDRAWLNPGESGSGKETNGVDDDGNGYVDDVNGWDFFHKDKTVHDTDDFHGTHVSGTIAASANNQGVVGVAPNVEIMALKFIGPNGGLTSDAILAIEYAAKKGAKISNNSWGGGGYSQSLKDAIAASGMLFVTSAGNGGADRVGDNNDVTPQYPASYDNPNILSVAAINNQGNLAYFSNYGPNSVDISAPGVDILSSIPGGSWAFYNGTSMASPHVTGAAALVGSKTPSFLPRPLDLKKALMDTGKSVSSTAGKTMTGKMVDANAALRANAPLPDPIQPAGTVSINVGAAGTTSSLVWLTLSASDNEGGSGVRSMRFSNDGTSWSGWAPYATNAWWGLSPGLGTKTVYVQYQDWVDNVSDPAQDDIFVTPAKKKHKKKHRH
jgi:subtilisin family serine protease